MATKKFSQMTTKKLTALLATASEEDKVAIEEVLAAREQAQAPAAPVEEVPAASEEAPLSPEEEAALEAAEKNGGLNPMYNDRTAEKKQRMTDEERHALAEQLKANINHRCQAVPFNTIDWVDGYIAGVIEEKRSNKVLYAIKTDDGRRIVKVHDSNLVRIFDEVITFDKKPKRTRVNKEKSNKPEKIDWTPEVVAEEINKYISNVGKAVAFEKYRITDENGEEHVEMVNGRIVAIVPDKRVQRLLYRISVPTPVEGNPLATKFMHRVVTSEALQIAEEFDAEGQEFNAKYCARRETSVSRSLANPQDRVIRCEENVKKVEAKLQKVTEELETKKKQLEEAKAELDAYLAAQTGETSVNSPVEEADPLA